MSHMVFGEVMTFGCIEYQTRTHNVVGIIENKLDWTLESYYNMDMNNENNMVDEVLYKVR